MDQLVTDFRKVELSSESLSAVDIMEALATVNKTNIKIIKIPLGDDSDKGMYSVTISIDSPEDSLKFSSSGHGKIGSMEKASTSALKFLIQEAEDRLGPRPTVSNYPLPETIANMTTSQTSQSAEGTNLGESNLKSKVNEDTPSTEDIPLKASIDSQLNNPQLQDEFDRLFNEDEKLADMFDDLMLKNYRVFKYEKEEFDSNTSSRLYKATIRIPQLGEFITASRTSMRDAVRGACLKVKYHLKNEGIADYDIRPTRISAYQGNQFPSRFFTGVSEDQPNYVPTPRVHVANPKQASRIQRLPKLDATNEEAPELDPLDSLLQKSDADELSKLSDYELLTGQKNKKVIAKVSSATIQLESKSALNPVNSDAEIADPPKQADDLNKTEILVDIFTGPETHQNNNAAKEFFLGQNDSINGILNGMPTCFDKPHEQKKMPTELQPEGTAKEFSSVIGNEKESFEQFLDNPKTMRRFSTGSGTSRVSKRDPSPPMITMGNCPYSKRVNLVKNFKEVYNHNKTPVAILNDLLGRYSRTEMPPLYISTSYEPTSRIFQSTVNVEALASLTAIDFSESESRRKVQLKAYHFIKDLTTLAYAFKTVYSAEHSPLHIIEELARHNPTMVNIISANEGNIRSRCTIHIVNINSFMALGSTEAEAKETAARNTIDYFKEFVDTL